MLGALVRSLVSVGLNAAWVTGVAQAVPPPAPSPCATGPGTYAGVSITWTDVAGEDGYRVYRDGVAIVTLGSGVITHLDLEVPGPGPHTYCVEAFNVDGPSPTCCSPFVVAAPPITVEAKHWYHDTFPASNTTSPSSPAFDREPARIKTGLNLIPLTGDPGRMVVPGDTVVANAAGADLRMDLVFRIKPGPGNYDLAGALGSGLRVDPLVPGVIAVPGGPGFWGAYMAAPGIAGTAGGAALHAAFPSGWNWNVWNSARCDTAEKNIFPYDVDGVALFDNFPGLTPGIWASMYHEADPKFVALGIAKLRCFAIAPSMPPTQANITCGAPPYPPAWTAAPASGFDPAEIPGLPVGDTYEYTKIIPDGLLTAGSHVQYFLRLSDTATLTQIGIDPDTNVVVPQLGSSLDGQRWEHFGVLPDRWKHRPYGGPGTACMLVVDFSDGDGNERVWTSTADSIGATELSRVGAHNGWGRVPAGGDPNNPAYFVRAHGGQPGTTWDFFKVRGSRDTLTGNAGSLGTRAAPQAAAGAPASGRESRIGPTEDMLLTYYRTMLILTGDRNVQILGPVANRGQDDWGLLVSFLNVPGGTALPRGLMINGSGFVESEQATHPMLVMNGLRLSLRHANYSALSGNAGPGAALTVVPPVASFSTTHGLVNGGNTSLDVLNVQTPVPSGQAAAFYENVGGAGPYVAGVYAPDGGVRLSRTLTMGWNIADLGTSNNVSSAGRLRYFCEALNNTFGPLNCINQCQPPGDVPLMGHDAPRGKVLWLRNNPLVSGTTTIRLTLPRADRVHVAIYDLAGRQVSVLAHRAFEAGAHDLEWDGKDARGRPMGAGFYMVRVTGDNPESSGAAKITVLR